MIDTIERGEVRELRLARPPVNALTRELLDDLRGRLAAAPADGVRAVVLSGSPGIFTGGLDVPHLMGLDREAMVASWISFFAIMKALAASPVPVAAAITGHSPAGGLVLAMFCDYRVMAEGDYRIGLNEVQVGIPLPRVLLGALRRLVGPRRAEAMTVGGLLVDPATALGMGLVDELAAVEQVVDRAVAWCRGLLELPAHAVAETRQDARADLVALFDGLDDDAAAAEVERCWYDPETQAVLAQLVKRLREK